MKWYIEDNLSNFKFWGGATDRVGMLTDKQLDEIGEALERDLYNEEMPEGTAINDLFWHDFEFCCSLIGLYYASDGNVYDSREDWAEVVVEANFPDIEEGEFDDFIDYAGSDVEDWESEADVISAFKDYLERYDEDDAEDKD